MAVSRPADYEPGRQRWVVDLPREQEVRLTVVPQTEGALITIELESGKVLNVRVHHGQLAVSTGDREELQQPMRRPAHRPKGSKDSYQRTRSVFRRDREANG